MYLASREIDKVDTTTSDFEKSKTLKLLFLQKIGDDAHEVYNSKIKYDKSDKLTEVFKFMSDHYAPKRSMITWSG